MQYTDVILKSYQHELSMQQVQDQNLLTSELKANFFSDTGLRCARNDGRFGATCAQSRRCSSGTFFLLFFGR